MAQEHAGIPAIADLTPAAEDKSVSGLVSSLTDLKRQKVQSDTKLSAESDASRPRIRCSGIMRLRKKVLQRPRFPSRGTRIKSTSAGKVTD